MVRAHKAKKRAPRAMPAVPSLDNAPLTGFAVAKCICSHMACGQYVFQDSSRRVMSSSRSMAMLVQHSHCATAACVNGGNISEAAWGAASTLAVL
jgi:hypothetical protein